MAKKKTYVPISTIGDLTGLVNHNCDVLERRIKKLAKSSRNTKLLCLIAVGYAIYATVECRKQEERVYQLSVMLKKLECAEGE